MEVELFSNVVSEEDTVEVDAENDNFGAEGERCGICMDIVVDRGVLDCCQHWFCFVCIDNWASITNLCPLCQNEFQLITCVPVYDTIGGSKTEEDSDLRDDDWSVEGKNNTLSFPSYYIDENAVTCLDRDGCKIRNGSVTFEENLTLDTSIACDSCDTWYHAFCVGFDPEGTDVDSWLCPRCLANEDQPKSDSKEAYSIHDQLNSESADRDCLGHTFSGKVSVSVADAGETAVVVSRIGSENVFEESTADHLSTREITHHLKIEQSMLDPDSCSSELNNSMDQGIRSNQPNSTVPSANLYESIVKSEPIESDSTICLDSGLALATTLSEDDKDKILVSGDECLHDALDKSISKDESMEDIKAGVAPKMGEKRKRADYSFLTNDEDGHDEVRLGSRSSTKKVKAQRGNRKTSLNDQAHIVASDGSHKSNSQIESSPDEVGGNVPVNETLSTDIMSIVRGTEPKNANGLIRRKEADKCAKGQKSTARLRMKKIMRPSDDQESADVVQKLRKEIREAVRNKPPDGIGKSIVDPNLLQAFRAAVAGSSAEPVKKASMRAKKLVLEKSKTRENLTKKIYATSNGKRRRAWDRDCQVEFWKHRCLTTSKAEKIDTLRSVLTLLRRRPDTKQVEHNFEEEGQAPILTRLYLADASVFPRKDDIKPLSVLKAAAGSKKNEQLSSAEKDIEACEVKCTVKASDSNEVHLQGNTSTADDKKNKNSCTRIKNGVASGKLHSERQADESSKTKMNGISKTDDAKIDKRKWALEVLARKTASNSTSSTNQNQDNAVFKGNYPLLAELPTDMRPKLAPIHHNKIPASVRQAQLFRLTEHFLKMANLSSISRSAATELAVADAINIEKQVAEKSNSKVVYLNLCSQEIRHHIGCGSSAPVEPTPSSPGPAPAEGVQSSVLSLDSEAEAALRTAGLLSDSPPSSPHHNVEDPSSEGEEEGTGDIFEMDSNPDLDIYGDFEYDLDEDYGMDISAIKASKSQADDGDSKVKVVFSTLSSNKTDNSPEIKEQDVPKTGILLTTSSLLETCNDAGSGSSGLVGKDSVPADTPLNGECEELSLVECEELYGPDKEPLVQKFPDLVPSENNLETKIPQENSLILDSHHGIAVGGKSPSSSQAVENTHEEKNSDPKVGKKGEHADLVLKKVEAYIKEHIRPLCKSGVITAEQYRWAVGKTTEKVMKYHTKSKNANFLIKEGEKVKKLAEQYVEAAKHKEHK